MWTPGCPVSCVSPVFRVGPRRRPAGVPRPLDVALVSPRSEARDRGKGTVVPRKRGSYGEESAPSGKVGGGSRGGGSTARPRPCLRRWWPQLSRLLSSPPAAPHSTLATPPPFRDGDGAARSSFCRVGAGTPPSHLNQWGRAGLSLLGEGRAGASSFSAQRAGPPCHGPHGLCRPRLRSARRTLEVTYGRLLCALPSRTPPQWCAAAPWRSPRRVTRRTACLKTDEDTLARAHLARRKPGRGSGPRAGAPPRGRGHAVLAVLDSAPQGGSALASWGALAAGRSSVRPSAVLRLSSRGIPASSKQCSAVSLPQPGPAPSPAAGRARTSEL